MQGRFEALAVQERVEIGSRSRLCKGRRRTPTAQLCRWSHDCKHFVAYSYTDQTVTPLSDGDHAEHTFHSRCGRRRITLSSFQSVDYMTVDISLHAVTPIRPGFLLVMAATQSSRFVSAVEDEEPSQPRPVYRFLDCKYLVACWNIHRSLADVDMQHIVPGGLVMMATT